MSTTPQRYGLKIDGDLISIIPHKEGKYILFTEAEADKARAVEKVQRSFEVQQRNYILLYEAVMGDGSITSELINPEDVARRLRSTIATHQATIARLTEQAKLNELITELSAEPPQWQVELTFTQEDQWLAKVKRQFGHSQFYQCRSASLFAALSVAFNTAKQDQPTQNP